LKDGHRHARGLAEPVPGTRFRGDTHWYYTGDAHRFCRPCCSYPTLGTRTGFADLVLAVLLHCGHAPVLPTWCLQFSLTPIGKTGPCPLQRMLLVPGRGQRSFFRRTLCGDFKRRLPEKGWLSPGDYDWLQQVPCYPVCDSSLLICRTA